MVDDHHNLAALVHKAKEGNWESLEQLVDMFQTDIFRMVYYRMRSRMDAEDLTQEIFVQMVKSLPTLKDVDRFRPWLFRIGLNKVRDYKRKKRFLVFWGSKDDPGEFNQTDENVHSNPGPLKHMVKQEFWNRFNLLMDTLSRWEREVFTLRFMDHLGIKEIARTLSKSESSVKTHLYRAIKKIKEDPMLPQLLKGGQL